MFFPGKLPLSIAAVACFLTSSASPMLAPCSAAPVACAGGSAGGVWKLPATDSGTGAVLGHLVDESTGARAFDLRGLLTGARSPCLSCIEGRVQGSLDDGSGGAPEYVVHGRYLGSLFAGTGQLQLRVLRPGGGPTVGFLHGSFEDAPRDGQPGRFIGSWRVCP